MSMHLTHSHNMQALAGALLASLLSACAVGTTYQPPDIAQPQRFRHAPQRAQESTAAWWRDFDDPQLTRLVEDALTANHDLAQALARIEQAQAWTLRARADRLPIAEVSAQARRQRESLESPQGRISRGSAAFKRSDGSREAGLGASWELDLFGRLHRQSQAAQARYEHSSAEWHGMRVAVAAQTADAYVMLLQARLQQMVLRRQIDNLRLAVQLDQQRYGAKIIAIAPLHRTQAALASLQAEWPGLEQLIEVQRNRLAVLVGQSPTDFELPALPQRLPEAAPLAGFDPPGALLRSRPDVMAAEQRLIEASAQVGSAMAGYYPNLSLSGVLGLQAATGGAFTSGDAVNAAGLLGLRWRLFDFARVDAEIRQARGQHAEALAAYRQTLLLATEDVENALQARSSTYMEWGKNREAAASLEKACAASHAAWAAQRISRLAALEAEQQWLSALRKAIAAEGRSITSQIQLYKASGKA